MKLKDPSQELVFTYTCSKENPCNKERYEYVYSYDGNTRIAFRDSYKYYNCIFCMPKVEHACKEVIGVNTAKNILFDDAIIVKLPNPLKVVEIQGNDKKE